MKRMIQFKNYILLLLGCICLVGCGDTAYTEGEITYEISYPEYDKKENPLMYTMLPKEQILTFKNNDFKSAIKKAFVEISMNVNTEKEDMTMFFNFNEGNYSELSQEDKEKMKNSLPNYKVELLPESKELAGLKVKKAIATKGEQKIELWYTEDIAMTNPNWFNPFPEVPGVLLQYTLKNYGLTMQFTAQKFEAKTVTSEDLAVTNTDKEINYSSMIELLETSLKEYK